MIWDVQADVFLPCAASRLVTKDQVNRMLDAGMKIISAGANVPFADNEIFFGPIGEYTDEHLSLIPDFISNCGMARVFGYLMQHKIEVSDEAIFEDVSRTIRHALVEVMELNPGKLNIARSAFEIALKQLT